jgi:hypothetical protein
MEKSRKTHSLNKLDWLNHIDSPEISRDLQVPGLVNVYITMENQQFFIGKSTISMAMAYIANC